jgi:hypothetical protein
MNTVQYFTIDKKLYGEQDRSYPPDHVVELTIAASAFVQDQLMDRSQNAGLAIDYLSWEVVSYEQSGQPSHDA